MDGLIDPRSNLHSVKTGGRHHQKSTTEYGDKSSAAGAGAAGEEDDDGVEPRRYFYNLCLPASRELGPDFSSFSRSWIFFALTITADNYQDYPMFDFSGENDTIPWIEGSDNRFAGFRAPRSFPEAVSLRMFVVLMVIGNAHHKVLPCENGRVGTVQRCSAAAGAMLTEDGIVMEHVLKHCYLGKASIETTFWADLAWKAFKTSNESHSLYFSARRLLIVLYRLLTLQSAKILDSKRLCRMKLSVHGMRSRPKTPPDSSLGDVTPPPPQRAALPVLNFDHKWSENEESEEDEGQHQNKRHEYQDEVGNE